MDAHGNLGWQGARLSVKSSRVPTRHAWDVLVLSSHLPRGRPSQMAAVRCYLEISQARFGALLVGH